MARRRAIGCRSVTSAPARTYSDEARAIEEVVKTCEEVDIAPGDGRARPAATFAFSGEQHDPRVDASEGDALISDDESDRASTASETMHQETEETPDVEVRLSRVHRPADECVPASAIDIRPRLP